MAGITALSRPNGFGMSPLLDPVTQKILLFLWMAYILLTPFYVFSSGLPQPGDYLIIILAGMAVTIFVFKQPLVFNRVFSTLFLMVGLFVSINLVNYYYFRDTLFLFSSSYYVFNMLAFCATIILFKSDPDRFVRLARQVIFASLLIEFLWIFTNESADFLRNSGTFNNPNQMGYWAFLSGASLLVLNFGRRMQLYDIAGFAIAMLLTLESLSRAAALSFMMLIVLFFIGRYVGAIPKILFAVVILLYLMVQFVLFGKLVFLTDDVTIVNQMIERVDSTIDPATALEKRGFDRLMDNPQYLFFGAGEGSFGRFSPIALELHSGLGTLLFSYGILGFLLFFFFSVFVFRRAHWMLWITLIAVMVYGLTHQHIRFTSFWIFMALAYGMVRYVPWNQDKKAG